MTVTHWPAPWISPIGSTVSTLLAVMRGVLRSPNAHCGLGAVIKAPRRSHEAEPRRACARLFGREES